MKPDYLLILILFLQSCISENVEYFSFDPRLLKENNVALTEIADEIAYIPHDNKFPLGLIYNKIIIVNNSIYLSTLENGIMVYDRRGTFVRKIGNFGRGPGEYRYCFDISVDDKNGTVFNRDQNEIQVFSKTGYFLRSISLQYYGGTVNAFESYNSNLLISFLPQTGDPKYDWIAIDTLGNLIGKQEMSVPPFACDWLLSGESYEFENRVFFWDHFTDTVYSIMPDLKEKPSFIICPGDHRMPKSNFSFEQYNKYLEIKQIFETDQFFVIRYHYLKPGLLLFDKKSGVSFLTYLEGDDSGFLAWKLSGGITNDLDGGLKFLPNNYCFENGREYMVGLINPFQLKMQVASNEFKKSNPKYPEKKKEIERLANSLKETDNPVLVLVRLKK